MRNYLKQDALFPPSKWAKGLQLQTLGKSFFTTNNSLEVLNAFFAKGLPRGELKFKTALSHVRKRMIRIKIKEAGLKKIAEFRKRTSRDTTMKRSIRLRIAKKLKSTKLKLDAPDIDLQKANIRLNLLWIGKTHTKKATMTKAAFEAWFQSFQGKFNCVIFV